MDLLTRDVLVLEPNRTRAELYELWLKDCDVRLAHTERQAQREVRGRGLLVVADQGFADGGVDAILDAIGERVPVSRTIATRQRDSAFPRLSADHQFVKPVSEGDLTEQVRRLLLQNNYHLALRLYYRTGADMTYFEINDTDGAAEDERYEQLQARLTKLKRLIGALQAELSQEDVVAVRNSLSFEEGFEAADSAEKIDSKYKPDACSSCGQSWASSAGDDPSVSQLGAHVYRCLNCGHVQMGVDPSHQDIGSYRR